MVSELFLLLIEVLGITGGVNYGYQIYGWLYVAKFNELFFVEQVNCFYLNE